VQVKVVVAALDWMVYLTEAMEWMDKIETALLFDTFWETRDEPSPRSF